MRSSKSRSRNKSNRNRPNSVGNVVNRVFDSSGPEGKVRGTPQQIIEKYNQLARDAQLANDRVATENFQQHAEHYLRLLGEAQKEIDAKREQDAKREAQERENRERQAERDRERAQQQNQHNSDRGGDGGVAQPDHADQGGDDGGSDLVETPEGKAAPKRGPRKPRQKHTGDDYGQAKGDAGGDGAQGGQQPEGDTPRPKPRRARKPKTDDAGRSGDAGQGNGHASDASNPSDTAAE